MAKDTFSPKTFASGTFLPRTLRGSRAVVPTVMHHLNLTADVVTSYGFRVAVDEQILLTADVVTALALRGEVL